EDEMVLAGELYIFQTNDGVVMKVSLVTAAHFAPYKAVAFPGEDDGLPGFQKAVAILHLLFRSILFYPIHHLRHFNGVFIMAQLRIVGKGIFIAGVVEEREELIILLVLERIVWMAVALNTAERCSH